MKLSKITTLKYFTKKNDKNTYNECKKRNSK